MACLGLFTLPHVSLNASFLHEVSIFFITSVDPCLQFCGCRSIWGKKVACIFFNRCSQLLIFNLPFHTRFYFNCCHHASTFPRNVCTTKETRRSSGTLLNSKTSSIANTQFKNSSGWDFLWNSGMLSLNLLTRRFVGACARC